MIQLKEFSVRFVNYSPKARASDDYLVTETGKSWKSALRQAVRKLKGNGHRIYGERSRTTNGWDNVSIKVNLNRIIN